MSYQPDSGLYEEGQFPHCDPRVLHAPGECEFCDHNPRAQEARVVAMVNFTGENRPNLKPCPADEARGFKQAHVWHGNRPYKANARCTTCGGSAFSVFNSIECLSMFCIPKDGQL